MYEWAHDKCIPLVREITFQNGEELTEEGLPFLILFHKKDDTQSLQYYQNEISRSLVGEKVSFLVSKKFSKNFFEKISKKFPKCFFKSFP